ncbi:hypothetical protein BJV82DRAFT_624338 [Fennellomyces sp. T-0311]|nr:hypothetical protein BJV82DRAFT_659431 [Fennellomyces sp. T-0311]KAI8140232.1 hypothetical protein BJV82DRAFT_624338 [Fennellomyces sp. T-0311]
MVAKAPTVTTAAPTTCTMYTVITTITSTRRFIISTIMRKLLGQVVLAIAASTNVAIPTPRVAPKPRTTVAAAMVATSRPRMQRSERLLMRKKQSRGSPSCPRRLRRLRRPRRSSPNAARTLFDWLLSSVYSCSTPFRSSLPFFQCS